jgi:hypothetical protein
MRELEVVARILYGDHTYVLKQDEITGVKRILKDIHKISLRDFTNAKALFNCVYVEIAPDDFLYGRPVTILTNSSGRVLSFRLITIDLE